MGEMQAAGVRKSRRGARRDEIIARLRAFLNAESEMLERYEGRQATAAPARHPAEAETVAALEPAAYVDEPLPADTEPLAEEPPAEVPLDTEELEEVLQEVTEEEPAAEEPAAPEIEVEVIDEKPTPEIEVEVIDKPPVKKKKSRKKAASEPEEVPSASFFSEDVPSHFADDEEPLSFRFFESNEEEADPTQFLSEGEEMTKFAPIPEDVGRKNGRPPRSEDRSPSDSTWIVRPVVSSQARAAKAAPGTDQSDEIDKIRRILSDLD